MQSPTNLILFILWGRHAMPVGFPQPVAAADKGKQGSLWPQTEKKRNGSIANAAKNPGAWYFQKPSQARPLLTLPVTLVTASCKPSP
jgi:hypothetical protein